jgi:serine/threonine protein kinase/tetratricopeptide (TPR) repeat protein
MSTKGALVPGKLLAGRYRIIRQAGEGGMAMVFEATDIKHNRSVALKVLRGELANQVGAERFRREIGVLAQLSHPNIVPLYESAESDGLLFYVMPFVVGEGLDARLAREGRLSLEEALRITQDVARALSYAHKAGVIHRDLKPGNIMLSGGVAVVTDFGIARFVEDIAQDRLTFTGIAIGTPAYMSPEQGMGTQPVGPRSDQYSLACVLYEMLAGEKPYNGLTPLATLAMHTTSTIPDIRQSRLDIPPALAATINIALSKNPDERFGTIDAFAAQLDPASGAPRRSLAGLDLPISMQVPNLAAPPSSGNVTLPRVQTPKPPTERPTRASLVARSVTPPPEDMLDKTEIIPVAPKRRRALWALAAGTVIAIIGGVAWFVARPSATTVRQAGATGTPQTTVLIGTLANRTGDSTLDALLPELLATSLEQSHTVAVYPRANIPFVLRRMQRPPETAIDDSVGREIATREGLSAVLEESITKLDPGNNSSYVLVVSAVLPDGRQLVSSRQTFADLGELPARVDSVGNALRKAFGESADLVRASTPLEQVTSRSLDAVRLYSLGRERANSGDPLGAMPLLQRAIELDSGFAMAHGMLGIAYTNVLDMVNATRHLQIAARLAPHAPPAEREKILADYAMSRRDFNAACPHYQVLMALRPRDYTLPIAFGWCSAQKLDFGAAVSATERGFKMMETPKTRINRAIVAFLAGNLTQARDDAHLVRTQVPTWVQAWYVEAKALLALGDYAAARTMYEQMISQGGDMAVTGHDGLADLARSTGRLEEARKELELAHRDAIVRGNPAVATNAMASLAELALEQHRTADFRAAMAATGARSPDPWVVYRVGRAWARSGNAAEVDSSLRALDSLSIGPSPQYDALKALLRSELALATSQPDQAVSEAEAAVRFEPSTVAYETLARADLAAKRPTEAATAFDQVVRRGHERCESYDSPACYRAIEATYWLGRLRDEAGDHAGAVPLLRKFVTAWAGAKGQPLFDDATRRLSGK